MHTCLKCQQKLLAASHQVVEREQDSVMETAFSAWTEIMFCTNPDCGNYGLLTVRFKDEPHYQLAQQ